MSGKITDFFQKKDNGEDAKDVKVDEAVVEKIEIGKKTTKKAAAQKKRKVESSDEEKEEEKKEKQEKKEKKTSKKRKVEEEEEDDEETENEDKQDEKTTTGGKVTNYYDDIESYFTDKNWREALKGEFNKPYFKDMIKKLNQCYSKSEKPIYPPKNEIFSAFNYAHLKDVKVVIVGQDPYHGAGQAHGLSFSVKQGIKPPPSLVNIYKELETDIPGFKRPLSNGFLEPWAKQGVFLLNAALTVEEATPNSHKDYGWYQFTDAVLKILNQQEQPIVFVLWGGFAKKKEKLFDSKKHCILTSGHPSPLSIKSFTGCKHFSKANEYLKSKKVEEIDWTINE